MFFTASNTTSLDIYDNVFKPRPALITSLIFSLVGVATNVALFYGIIWYERFGSDNKRTLMNKLFSSQCWCTIHYLCMCQMADIVRFIVGPYPEFICFMLTIVKNAIKAQILLFIDATLLVQYLFIFWLKNPAGVNDDFWSCFITIWIRGFSLIFYLTKLTIDTKKPIVYYICSNILPDNFSSLPNSFQGRMLTDKHFCPIRQLPMYISANIWCMTQINSAPQITHQIFVA